MRTGPTFGVSRANRKLFRVISPVLRICAGPDALGAGCPKTPLLRRSQATDSVCPEFPVLDAHKELILGICPVRRLIRTCCHNEPAGADRSPRTGDCEDPGSIAQGGRIER